MPIDVVTGLDFLLQIRVLQIRILQIRVLQIRVLQICVLQIRVLQIRVLQIRVLQIQSVFYKSNPVHVLSPVQTVMIVDDSFNYHSLSLTIMFAIKRSMIVHDS